MQCTFIMVLLLLEYQVTLRMTNIPIPEQFFDHWTDSLVKQRCLIYKIIMKGERKRKNSQFKKGVAKSKGRHSSPGSQPEHVETFQYIRPTEEEQKLLENPPIKRQSLPRTTAVCEPSTGRMFLRSSPGTHSKTASQLKANR